MLMKLEYFQKLMPVQLFSLQHGPSRDNFIPEKLLLACQQFSA